MVGGDTATDRNHPQEISNGYEFHLSAEFPLLFVSLVPYKCTDPHNQEALPRIQGQGKEEFTARPEFAEYHSMD